MTTIITRFRASLLRTLPIWDVEILEVEPTDLIDLFQYLAAIDLITDPPMYSLPSQNPTSSFHPENQVGDQVV